MPPGPSQPPHPVTLRVHLARVPTDTEFLLGAFQCYLQCYFLELKQSRQTAEERVYHTGPPATITIPLTQGDLLTVG